MTKFEILQVVRRGNRGSVLAKRLTPEDFAVSMVGSFLGDCPLNRFEGRSESGVYAFGVNSFDDASRLVRGSVVALSG